MKALDGMVDRHDVASLAAIARRYYLDDVSKIAIGREFGLSRFQVARALDEARCRGVVTIEIRTDTLLNDELGDQLRNALGLRRVLVVAAVPDQTQQTVLRRLGRALATLLRSEVQEGETLGLAWSRVDAAMVEQLDALEPCTVVQLAGHLITPAEGSDGIETVRRAAKVAGGRAYPIYAPMLVADADTAAVLRHTPEVAEALARANDLDRAVVSIGAWGSSRSRLWSRLALEDKDWGETLGAVGEISGRVFDLNGQAVPDFLDDRVIAVTFDQLKRTPEVIGTCWGAESAEALQVASQIGLVHTAVVDEDLARTVLDRL